MSLITVPVGSRLITMAWPGTPDSSTFLSPIMFEAYLNTTTISTIEKTTLPMMMARVIPPMLDMARPYFDTLRQRGNGVADRVGRRGPHPPRRGRGRSARRPRLCGSRFLGEAEEPLADDVALDLRGAAPDGLGPGEEERRLHGAGRVLGV